jgi:hypothetical protein
MDVKVHVLGFRGDAAVQEGEEPTALLHGVLEIDGHLLSDVGKIEVIFRGGEFAVVKPHVLASAFEVVRHTRESWDELSERIDGASTQETDPG